MLLRPFLNDPTSCASYLFGCGTHAKLAVVDPHADLVDDYLAAAAALGAPLVAVFETHVQAKKDGAPVATGWPATDEKTHAKDVRRFPPKQRGRTTSPGRATIPRPHGDHTATAFSSLHGVGEPHGYEKPAWLAGSRSTPGLARAGSAAASAAAQPSRAGVRSPAAATVARRVSRAARRR